MNKTDFRIVYMATADFALPSLQALVEGGYNVRAVVTMPDKPAGRGMKLQESSIKRYAQSVGIEVLQPVKLKDEAFVNRLREIAPDLGIVVAFRMLPEVVWSLPRLGTINLHGSLLPRYRGAAPIHWAVINGDTETGVTTFRLKHELDTGDIILQAPMPIAPDETTGQVHDRMMALGAETLLKSVDLFLSSEPTTVSQAAIGESPTEAPKLTKENTQVNWHKSARELYNFIRGLYPYPSAWAELQVPQLEEPIVCKLHASQVVERAAEHLGKEVGQVVVIGKKHLDVICGEGVLRITQLQPSGKKSMPASAWLNGLR
ncbi:MAG: methionyl-tRNA formyltransferase [Porphyromonadaceae bacterium]|nr:methionyl-tRNA formyltransferase [Porphyromonadaceae bacterium]